MTCKEYLYETLKLLSIEEKRANAYYLEKTKLQIIWIIEDELITYQA